MMGRMTDAGMGGIDDAEGEVVECSAGEVTPVICGDVDVEGEDVSCADVESAGAIEAVCCESKEASTFTVSPDTDSGAISFLNTKGIDVRGGGSGAPFGSPRTLRLKGGSSAAADLPFLPPTLESLPPAAALVAARASCSSNIRSQSASTVQ